MYEVARKDWWYRKDFVVPEKFKGQRLTLVFDGVDHECAVWLNGKQIGGSAGMFRRFWFDVAEHVKPGQKNSLAVRIVRMPEQLAAGVSATDGRNEQEVFWAAFMPTRQTLKDLKSPTKLRLGLGRQHLDAGNLERPEIGGQRSGPYRLDAGPDDVERQVYQSHDHNRSRWRWTVSRHSPSRRASGFSATARKARRRWTWR